jgi:hypothetical protein
MLLCANPVQNCDEVDLPVDFRPRDLGTSRFLYTANRYFLNFSRSYCFLHIGQTVLTEVAVPICGT